MQNEILKPVLDTDTTAVPRYDIISATGEILYQNVKMQLKNEVMQEGTPYDTASVLPNSLCDQLGIPQTSKPADASAALLRKSTSTKVNITLSASGWNIAKKYTLNNASITATSAVELLPRENNGITQSQMEALSGAMIVGGTQTEGSIQLVALGYVPTIDIPVTIIIRRDL